MEANCCSFPLFFFPLLFSALCYPMIDFDVLQTVYTNVLRIKHATIVHLQYEYNYNYNYIINLGIYVYLVIWLTLSISYFL